MNNLWLAALILDKDRSLLDAVIIDDTYEKVYEEAKKEWRYIAEGESVIIFECEPKDIFKKFSRNKLLTFDSNCDSMHMIQQTNGISPMSDNDYVTENGKKIEIYWETSFQDTQKTSIFMLENIGTIFEKYKKYDKAFFLKMKYALIVHAHRGIREWATEKRQSHFLIDNEPLELQKQFGEGQCQIEFEVKRSLFSSYKTRDYEKFLNYIEQHGITTFKNTIFAYTVLVKDGPTKQSYQSIPERIEIPRF